MAQLNPNFEIDFSDINSYEQIQLINDTQLAKENLLMHRAYKEPSDDEIIRNQFSSFTFVDFCPKLYSIKSPPARYHTQESELKLPESVARTSSSSSKCYELESFSDLFERINTWLKLNKDWRVVSMETLIYDCTSQFNHQKSSIYSNYLPQNTRGLRLFLSPSKSRFSGPQKIGCINVVPRKVSGSYMKPEEPPVYETLDEILNRLNELLLTRPIEGQILSVETLTLPMVNGYVNTESNYFIDSRLNTLYESTYTFAHFINSDRSATINTTTTTDKQANHNQFQQQQCLIDILRVYYEFGPMVCGLVNLIDFLPRFYCSKQQSFDTQTLDTNQTGTSPPGAGNREQACENPLPKPVPKIAATETLTRLIRRSLAWFELERKRILMMANEKEGRKSTGNHQSSYSPNRGLDLKVCNLQVHQKVLLKGHLLQVNSAGAIQIANTRCMVHERVVDKQPIECTQCSISTTNSPIQDWCPHLIELTQPYNLKFVRLAYVVPLTSIDGRSLRPMRPMLFHRPTDSRRQTPTGAETFEPSGIGSTGGGLLVSDLSSTSSSSTSNSQNSSPEPPNQDPEYLVEEIHEAELQRIKSLKVVEEGERVNLVALSVLRETNDRHMSNELANQLQQNDDGLNDSPIGQLTYRLFAPCQLVNSSSCFSINPVNSSSPLARRGSVNINGSGISSENANQSTSLLAQGSSCNSIPSSESSQQMVTSFGAFFPSISHDVMSSAGTSHDSGGRSGLPGSRLVGSLTTSVGSSASGNTNRYTTNEFETVNAIKRRMEVYVTTNSMKVMAGATLIVHLSDALSCLSTAIEQTVVKASTIYGSQRTSNTWISVYVLYAAVEEPQLPAQLLAQQKMRELSLIDEGTGAEVDDKLGTQVSQEVQQVNSLFDDDFKGFLSESSVNKRASSDTSNDQVPSSSIVAATAVAAVNQPMSCIRVEQNPIDSSLTLYNSAYDRTVALPTQPENHSGNCVDPAEFLGSDGVWIDEDPFSDKVVHMPDMAARKKRRKKATKGRRGHDDSQCSIM